MRVKKFVFLLFLLTIIALVVRNFYLSPSQNIFSSYITLTCKLKEEKEACFAKKLEKIAETQGATFAFGVLNSIKGDNSIKNCHLLAHAIGNGAYNKEPENWKGLLEDISIDCSYGAQHGILENVLADEGRIGSQKIAEICTGFSERASCSHILGHLLLLLTEGNVKEALNSCSEIRNESDRELCDRGVFMEVFVATNLIAHGLVSNDWADWSSRTDSLEEICREQQQGYSVSCWQEMAHALVSLFAKDEKLINSFCDKAEAKEARQKCKLHSMELIYGGEEEFDVDKLE